MRTRREKNVTHIFKKGKKEDQADQSHLSPWEGRRANHMKAIAKHIKDKKMTGSSQHGFMKGNSCLTKLIDSYNEMTTLVDEGRTVNILDPDF